MKSTLTLICNLFKYIYLLFIFILFAGKIYANGDIKLQVVQIILCILIPIAFSIISKAVVKVGHLGSIFHGGAQKKRIYTIVLMFLTALVWFWLIKNANMMHFPTFNSDVKNDLFLIVNLVNGFWPQTMPFWLFGIFFSSFCTFGILRTEPDLLSTLWLSILVGLLIRGMFLGNSLLWFELCLLSGAFFAIQYIRLLKKDLYGEEAMHDSAPKNKIKKAKAKKKNKKKANPFKSLFSKKNKKKNKKRNPRRAQNKHVHTDQNRRKTSYEPYEQDDRDYESYSNENRYQQQDHMKHQQKKPPKTEDTFSDIEQMLEKEADNQKREAIKAMKDKKSFYE